MKPFYKIGLISIVVWLFIVAFGFGVLSYKEETFLVLIMYLLFGGLITFPVYVIVAFIYYSLRKR